MEEAREIVTEVETFMSAPSSIAMWTLGADVALMGSIMLFVYRVLRNPTNPRGLRQLGELEGTIRSLIREAEGAGKSLNDQLIRRQENLEKTLFDLETCEKRVHRVQSKAEETRGNVDIAIVKVQKGLDALNGALNRFQTREQQVRGFADIRDSSRVESHQESFVTHPILSVKPESAVKSETINGRIRDTAMQSGANWYEAPEQLDLFSAEEKKVAQMGERQFKGELLDAAARQSVEEDSLKISSTLKNERVTQSVQASNFAESSSVRPDSIHRRISGEKVQSTPRVTREQLIRAQEMIQHGLSVDEVVARSGLAPEQVQLLMAVRQKQSEKRMAATRAPVKRAAVDPRLGVLGGSRR
jgi:hypothetical protein